MASRGTRPNRHAMIWRSIELVTGIDDLTGAWYGFWSGIGSDLGEFAIVGVMWNHLNCHETRCWRIKHRVHGTSGDHLCRKHYKRRTP